VGGSLIIWLTGFPTILGAFRALYPSGFVEDRLIGLGVDGRQDLLWVKRL
jgi:hypothetical protein